MIGTRAAGVNRALLLAVLLFSRAAAGQDCALDLTLPEPAVPAAPAAAGTPVVRVRRIEFAGARAVPPSRLRARMQVKPRRFWRPRQESLWTDARWRADQRALCDLYREHGHVTAVVGPPRLETLPRRGPASEQWVAVHIPVQEGPAYRLDRLTVEPGSLFTSEEARAVFQGAEPGQPYRHRAVREGVERLRQPYVRRGHATASATVALRPRRAEGRVDVDVAVEEGRPWFVGRIRFSGNRLTRDETLRRQLLLAEGELLDGQRVAASVRRLEELGVARVVDVTVTPGAPEEGRADVTFVLQERPRLRYGLSGGTNALEGVSVSAEVAAVNALGGAERFSASVQVGPHVESGGVSFTQPNLLGTSWWTGLELYADRLEVDGVGEGALPAYEREERRASAAAWRALGERSQVGASLALSRVRLATASPDPPPGFGERSDGRLSVTWRRDGWDHPWRPRQGLRTSASIRLSGGPLGGDTDALEGRARVFGLLPLGGRAGLGLGAQGGRLHALAGGPLPFDERYLLGGQDDLRGFDVRSVGPRGATGALEAGDRYAVVHAESHLDLSPGLRAVAFLDAGRVWADGEPLRLRSLRASGGLELRFELPVLRLPVRAIFAGNLARDTIHPRYAFRVGVGPLP
jgi:outer membrane protein insertion porin family